MSGAVESCRIIVALQYFTRRCGRIRTRLTVIFSGARTVACQLMREPMFDGDEFCIGPSAPACGHRPPFEREMPLCPASTSARRSRYIPSSRQRFSAIRSAFGLKIAPTAKTSNRNTRAPPRHHSGKSASRPTCHCQALRIDPERPTRPQLRLRLREREQIISARAYRGKESGATGIGQRRRTRAYRFNIGQPVFPRDVGEIVGPAGRRKRSQRDCPVRPGTLGELCRLGTAND
jgi:hypothetical protein